MHYPLINRTVGSKDQRKYPAHIWMKTGAGRERAGWSCGSWAPGYSSKVSLSDTGASLFAKGTKSFFLNPKVDNLEDQDKLSPDTWLPSR